MDSRSRGFVELAGRPRLLKPVEAYQRSSSAHEGYVVDERACLHKHRGELVLEQLCLNLRDVRELGVDGLDIMGDRSSTTLGATHLSRT